MSVTYTEATSDGVVEAPPGATTPSEQSVLERYRRAPHEQAAVLSRIAERLPTEASAYEYLEQRRWRDSPSCPHCGFVGAHVFLRPANGLSRRTNRGKYSERRVWKCRSCKRQFSVITATVMHGTHVPIRTWVLVAFEVAADGRGPTERDVARRYGLSTKSAHFLLRRIRDDLGRPAEDSLFAAVISDEPRALEPELPPRPGVPNDSDAYARQQQEPDSVIVMW